jgi:DNA-binding IscR family transcriptional regulator
MDEKPIYDVVSELNNPFVISRCENNPIEERMNAASLCQVFTFWREIQDILQQGSDEIKRLKHRVDELEQK